MIFIGHSKAFVQLTSLPASFKLKLFSSKILALCQSTVSQWCGWQCATDRDASQRTLPELHLTECIHHVVLERRLPHKIANLLFTSTSLKSSWRFGGGVDFLHFMNNYIVSDETAPPLQVLSDKGKRRVYDQQVPPPSLTGETGEDSPPAKPSRAPDSLICAIPLFTGVPRSHCFSGVPRP